MGADRNRGAGKGIEVEGLVRTFKDIHAVDGIDISIAPGEIYGFLGPNGAGKSTPMKIIAGFLPPTAGTAIVGGEDIRDSAVAAKRKLSSRAPGRLPVTQRLQTLLLGLAYDIYRVRRALAPFAS